MRKIFVFILKLIAFLPISLLAYNLIIEKGMLPEALGVIIPIFWLLFFNKFANLIQEANGNNRFKKFLSYVVLLIAFFPMTWTIFELTTQGAKNNELIGIIIPLFWLIGFGKLSLWIYDWSVKKYGETERQ